MISKPPQHIPPDLRARLFVSKQTPKAPKQKSKIINHKWITLPF
jgi:hypothetical protein